MWQQLVRGAPRVLALAAAATTAHSVARLDSAKRTRVRGAGDDFTLTKHCHGKSKVRVLKVRREDAGAEGVAHSISEYKVHTILFSPEYEKVFTEDDNTDLVATDTQKNTVYVVAKRTDAQTPEDFGKALAEHYLREYPILTGATVEVEEVRWARANVPLALAGDASPGGGGGLGAGAALTAPHAHGFLRTEPEHNRATVSLARAPDGAVDVSAADVTCETISARAEATRAVTRATTIGTGGEIDPDAARRRC